ncbi:MAG: hypothetical protein HY928_18315 [Elusimicrobia bacterium]|nr:hypothetical protein [Elusimicrobiota bacterium]
MSVRALLCALLAFPGPARALETVISARFLGGRLQTDGRPGAFSGSASGSAAAAVPLGPRWTFFPVLGGSYSGVESALDTAGGTTLFSEAMEHRVSLKAVYAPARGRWLLKPRAGWRMRLLRETKDEDWLSGLFDSHTVDGGVDLEWDLSAGRRLWAGYALSRTFFPNFNSLESSAPLDPRGRPLARELAGSGVLDFDAHLLSAGLLLPLPKGLALDLKAGLQVRRFLHQKLVRSDGSLGDSTRGDLVSSAEAGLRASGEPRPNRRLHGGLSVQFEDTVSDQACFDPARARFQERCYSYAAWKLGPDFGASWGDPRAPASLAGGLRYGWRRWPHRSARDGIGAYSGVGLLEQTWALSLEGRWPLAPGLGLMARVERSWARANDHYEGFHRFNHDATSLLFGVAFER